MAITYVGGLTGGRAGTTSTVVESLSGTLTGGSNTSPSAGDLVVVWLSIGTNVTYQATLGAISGNQNGTYTTLTQQTATDTNYSQSQLNYKIQGSTPDTSITIPSTGNIRNAQRWVIHVFRGVDTTTPFDVTSVPASGINTGRPDPSGITPTTAGAWIAAYYASAAATGTAYTAPTELSGWLGNTSADTYDCMQGGGYYSSWTSGEYNPQAITAGGTTGTGDSWTAMTVALRPNVPPTVALNSPADAATSVSITPTLNFTGTDSNSDTIEYQVQVHTSVFTSTYYSNASDSGPTDAQSAWASDSNAFNGSTANYAYSGYSGSETDGSLRGTGTNAPTSGDSISMVRARMYAECVSVGNVIYSKIYHSTSELGTATLDSQIVGIGPTYSSYVTLTTPSGGWTWQKVNDLESRSWVSGSALNPRLYLIEYEVTINPLLDKLSATPDAGFTSGHPFTSGVATEFTVQTGEELTASTTYYWRVRALDPTGSNTYGEWSAVRSFTTASAGVTQTHTTDALKYAQVTKTHTTDALKYAQLTKTHTTDSYLEVAPTQVTVTHTSDALKYARVTKTHTSDALKYAQLTRTHATDALKYVQGTKTHTTDSYLYSQSTKTHTTDSLKLARVTKTHTADALKYAQLTRTHTADALKYAQVTRTHTTDSYLQARVTVTHTTDSYLQAPAGVVNIGHSTDSLLQARLTASHTTDALKYAQITKVHTIDALLLDRNTAVHTTDSFLREIGVNTVSHSTDSLLLKVGAVSHTTDAVKYSQNTRTHTTDAYLEVGLTTNTVSHTTDSRLYTTGMKLHSTDSLLLRVNTATHTTDALLLDRNTVTHTTNALLKDEATVTHTTDALKLARVTKTHTADALAYARVTTAHTTDALAYDQNTVVHTTDAFKWARIDVAHTTDSFLSTGISSETVTHSTDSMLWTMTPSPKFIIDVATGDVLIRLSSKYYISV